LRFKKSVSFLLIFSLIFAIFTLNITFNTAAVTKKAVLIYGNGVNIRNAPSLSSQVITAVSFAIFDVTDIQGEWIEIDYNGQTAYVKDIAEWISVKEYNPEGLEAEFENQIKDFPDSYKKDLRLLHLFYPNWKFVPDKISNYSFYDLVKLETQDVSRYKQVQLGTSLHPISWRSMGIGCYNWENNSWYGNNGDWTGASREITAYYMDPRNFLNPYSIYTYLQQSYNASTQTEQGLAQVIKGTFLENGYVDENDKDYDGSYVKVIMAAAKDSGVSPYIIASKIIQEQGVNGLSSLISGTYTGYEGYYNFFNINASGSTTTDVIVNGLNHAKTNGWNTRSAAIIGGAKFLAGDYISRGQGTYFYQNYDLHGAPNFHQYAQNVADSHQKGSILSDTYARELNSFLEFYIPVYSGMPDTAVVRPEKSEKKNNYYIKSLNLTSGSLTPYFDMYTYNYILNVSEDTALIIDLPENAELLGDKRHNFKTGENKLTLSVKAETGYTNDYNITVNASKDCVLKINTGQCANSEHIFGEWEIINNATCTEYGTRLRVCGICGYEESEQINILGHDYNISVKEPNCKEQGYTDYSCKNCDYSYKTDFKEPSGHKLLDWQYIDGASEYIGGIRECKCEYCDYSVSEEIIPEALLHEEIGTNVVISKYNGIQTKLIIPSRINGIDVKEISDFAFQGRKTLTEIILPVTLNKIGLYAFDSCNKVTKLNIPDSVEYIDSGAFSECTRLNSIVIGKGIKKIGAYAFEYCEALTDVTILGFPTEIGEFAFDKADNVVVCADSIYVRKYCDGNGVKFKSMYAVGDANADNKVDVIDLIRLKHQISDNQAFIDRADVDRDYNVSAIDIIALKKSILQSK